MRFEFEDDDLKRLASELAFDMGLDRGIVKAFRMAVQAIDAGLDERLFRARPGWRFEKLSGNLRDVCSIRLNNQWRLLFRFRVDDKQKVVVIMSISDYH